MSNRKLTIRPTPEASTGLPLGVRSVGHYRIDSGFRIQNQRHCYELFWCIGGKGLIVHENTEFRMRTGDVFLYLPGDMHDHRAVGGEWEYDLMTLDGEGARTIIEVLGLERGVRPGRSCPHALFERLHALVRSPTPEDERKAGALAYEILQLATLPPLGGDRHFSLRIKQMIDERCVEVDFGVEQLADEFGTHRSTIYRRFKYEFGLSPSQYLARIRINLALEMLESSDLSLTDIAEKCGFSDLGYFGKAVRRATGHNAGALRQYALQNRSPGSRERAVEENK